MTIWTEIKPILGPLIQAAVVLIVGTATVIFQLSQAKTARNKLFTDLHDKRYKSLSGIQGLLNDQVRRRFVSDVMPARDRDESMGDLKAIQLAKDEVNWLFGEDVRFHVERLVDVVEQLYAMDARRIDDQTVGQYTDRKRELFANYWSAYGKLDEAARKYLYVGDIYRQASPAVFYKLQDIRSGTQVARRPRRK